MSLQHLEQETFTNEIELEHYSGMDKSIIDQQPVDVNVRFKG